jgi:DNA-directed RNA polymerase subunit RPC12/RpoP
MNGEDKMMFISDDDFDKNFIFSLTLKCADCGLIFKKEHQYVCPACSSRNVAKPTPEDFKEYYSHIDE